FNPAQIDGYTANDPAQFSWFVKKAIPSLTGKKLPKSIKKNLSESIKKMPVDSKLFIVGIMLSRNTSDIRMSVQFKDPSKIPSYLKEIGWTDADDTFETLIEDIVSLDISRVVLDFDVGEKIGRKIAIECSFAPTYFHEEERWDELLDYLVERGIVSPEKKDELLSFQGIDSSVMFIDQRQGKSNSNTIVRYITHIKIVYNPDEKKLKAKAYMAIRHFGTFSKMDS
ncbi:MAG: hypothetical protein DRO67_09810, partial [Candidatus Asgardarchaeum californiense]